MVTASAPAAGKHAAVLARQRNGLVGQPSLNQAAPFHIVEEESWMTLENRNLAAGIKAVNIESQFGDFVRRRVEIVARIESVVAVETPTPEAWNCLVPDLTTVVIVAAPESPYSAL